MKRKKRRRPVSSWQEGQTNSINIPKSPNRLGQGQHSGRAAVRVTHWQRPWKEKKTSENSEILQKDLENELILQHKKKQFLTYCLLFFFFFWFWSCSGDNEPADVCNHSDIDTKTGAHSCWIDFTILSYFPCIEMEFPGFQGHSKPVIHGWMNKSEVLKEIRRHKQKAFILRGRVSRGSAALCSFQRRCGWKLVCLWWILLWSSEETFILSFTWPQMPYICTDMYIFIYRCTYICVCKTCSKYKLFSNEEKSLCFYMCTSDNQDVSFYSIHHHVSHNFCISHSSLRGQPLDRELDWPLQVQDGNCFRNGQILEDQPAFPSGSAPNKWGRRRMFVCK